MKHQDEMIDPEATRTRPQQVSAVPPPPGSPRSTASWKAGDILLGEYRVMGILGRGGMGAVYRVRRRSDRTEFAVKTLREALLSHGDHRRAFLRELRTWMDLPDHPHLTACRFFRTIDDRIAVFSELVEGGSLKSWIQSGRLASPARVIEAAVQFAWGLHEAHVCGVVHQDVKPANALVTPDGVVKVTDFGLARARNMGQTRDEPVSAAGDSILISSGGMTPAYCSPEQAAKGKLSRKTDIWSWGVSLMEMFTGKVTWTIGCVASAVLDMIMGAESRTGSIPIPPIVVPVLRRCFASNPADRWETILQAADALADAYVRLTGEPFPRRTPAFPVPSVPEITSVRVTDINVAWMSPRPLLEFALEKSGRNVAEADLIMPKPSGSRKSRALQDIEVFWEVETMLKTLPGPKDRKIVMVMSRLLNNKAMAQKVLDDLPGVVTSFEETIRIGTDYLKDAFDEMIADGVATASINLAIVLSEQQRFADAFTAYDRAEEIWYDLVYHRKKMKWRYSLGLVYLNKAMVFQMLTRHADALPLFDKALDIFRVCREESPGTAFSEIGITSTSKARALLNTGDRDAALKVCREAIGIYEAKMTDAEIAVLIRHLLADAFNVEADILESAGDREGARRSCEKALDLMEYTVNREDRHDLKNKYADTMIRLANVTPDPVRAGNFYDRGIDLLETLVGLEGRGELVISLVEACLDRGEFRIGRKNEPAAREDLERAARLLDTHAGLAEQPVTGELRERIRRLFRKISD